MKERRLRETWNFGGTAGSRGDWKHVGLSRQLVLCTTGPIGAGMAYEFKWYLGVLFPLDSSI